ncbi:alpha/beta hydrolase [Nocardioides sp. 503]|uniref:alpha/beta hydrolase n=1 Tax=Nocardioides sp. 503 TaxID=2508326 RepID=UPI00106F61CA|nr:alpha/beta hydrolase [Nocardioides sp. 503]
MPDPLLDRQIAALAAAGPVAEPPGPQVREVRDLTVPAAGVPARLYSGELDDCVVVFLHGGGFVSGGLDSHDAHARALCRDTGRSVLAVDYRLAPEHRFPAAYDDAVAAVRWAREELGERVAVAGPSAGANLAMGAALALAGTDAAPVAQLLVNPLVHGDPAYASRSELADAYGLTSQRLEWCVGQYLVDPTQRDDPRFAALLSPDLGLLPPTVLVVAGRDPLRDEGRELGRRLRAAGVAVEASEEPGMPHGFWRFALLSDAAGSAVARMSALFRARLDEASGQGRGAVPPGPRPGRD